MVTPRKGSRLRAYIKGLARRQSATRGGHTRSRRMIFFPNTRENRSR